MIAMALSDPQIEMKCLLFPISCPKSQLMLCPIVSMSSFYGFDRCLTAVFETRVELKTVFNKYFGFNYRKQSKIRGMAEIKRFLIKSFKLNQTFTPRLKIPFELHFEVFHFIQSSD